MKNSTLRIITASAAAPVLIGSAYLGGWVFGLVVLGGALLIQWEVYDLMDHGGGQPRRLLGLLLATALVGRIFAPVLLPIAVVLVLLLVAVIPFEHKNEEPLVSLADTLFGAIYPTALLGFLLQLRRARGPQVGDLEAFYLTLSVLLLVWAADIGAYYVGRAVGRHPLAKRVSPNKTWEGAIGGFLAAVLVGCGLKLTVLGMLGWFDVGVLVLICGAIGQIGDLAESKFKRSVALKDSGVLLPGHGGLLDRFDAMIFAAPLSYLYLRYAAGLFG